MPLGLSVSEALRVETPGFLWPAGGQWWEVSRGPRLRKRRAPEARVLSPHQVWSCHSPRDESLLSPLTDEVRGRDSPRSAQLPAALEPASGLSGPKSTLPVKTGQEPGEGRCWRLALPYLQVLPKTHRLSVPKLLLVCPHDTAGARRLEVPTSSTVHSGLGSAKSEAGALCCPRWVEVRPVPRAACAVPGLAPPPSPFDLV